MTNTYYQNIYAHDGLIKTTESEMALGDIEPTCDKEIDADLFKFAIGFHDEEITYITTVGSDGTQQDRSKHWNNLREAVEMCKRDDSFHPSNYDDEHQLFSDAEEVDSGIYSCDDERGETFFIRRRG